VARQTKLNPILAALWGAAQVAAREKTKPGVFNQAIRDAAAAQNIDLSHINAAQYSVLRGRAVAVREGIKTYTEAPRQAEITHEMLPSTWFSRPLNEQNLFSKVDTSIAMTFEDNGVRKTGYFNVDLRNFQFTTKGALEDAIALEAQILARNYGYKYIEHITTKLVAL
jgi:hypothetical protein